MHQNESSEVSLRNAFFHLSVYAVFSSLKCLLNVPACPLCWLHLRFVVL